MEKLNSIYYCNQCKKIVQGLSDLLFVEEKSTRGFCSEKCIEKFYTPLIEHLDSIEKEKRKELSIVNEDVLLYAENPGRIQRLLQAPNYIWQFENDLDESYFAFISKYKDSQGEDFYLIALTLIYERKPSFILLSTATKNEEFLKFFQSGKAIEKIEDVLDLDAKSKVKDEKVEIEVGGEMVESLEQKKSSYLAELLENRSEADIPIESFTLYDNYLTKTLEDADEVFSYKDREGDTIFTYIKAYEKSGVSFYYFVICMNLGEVQNTEKEAIYPIICFPTLDGDLYKRYRQGDLIVGNLLN